MRAHVLSLRGPGVRALARRDSGLDVRADRGPGARRRVPALRTAGAAFALLCALSAAACAPSPRSLCEDERALTCERLHACTEPALKTPEWHLYWGESLEACEPLLEAGRVIEGDGFQVTVPPMACEGRTERVVCPDEGTLWERDAAERCVSDLTELPCEAWLDWRPAGGMDLPQACAELCVSP